MSRVPGTLAALLLGLLAEVGAKAGMLRGARTMPDAAAPGPETRAPDPASPGAESISHPGRPLIPGVLAASAGLGLASVPAPGCDASHPPTARGGEVRGSLGAGAVQAQRVAALAIRGWLGLGASAGRCRDGGRGVGMSRGRRSNREKLEEELSCRGHGGAEVPIQNCIPDPCGARVTGRCQERTLVEVTSKLLRPRWVPVIRSLILVRANPFQIPIVVVLGCKI